MAAATLAKTYQYRWSTRLTTSPCPACLGVAFSTMTEIVASVNRVTDIMGQITAASTEQSAGIEQVNQTVIQMDETTQQNAALVEEAMAAARAMEKQSSTLTQLVSLFQLEATSAHQVATKQVA